MHLSPCDLAWKVTNSSEYWRPNCTFKAHFLYPNFHYIITFFSHKPERKKRRGKERKNLATTLLEYQTLSRTLKPWNPYYKSLSHYKQAITVTNQHLITSSVRVRLAWSPWSKGHKSIHVTTFPVRVRLIWSPWSKGYNHSYMPYCA